MEVTKKEIDEKNREKTSRLWSNVRLLNALSFLCLSGFLIAAIVNKDLLTIQSAFFLYSFTCFMFCSSLTSRDALHLSKVETLLQDIQEIEKKHLSYRIHRRTEEHISDTSKNETKPRTFQQVVIYIEAPDALPILDMVSTLENLWETTLYLNCNGRNELNGFYLWDFVPTGMRLSVTSAEVSESSNLFPGHSGDMFDEDSFKRALWNVENNPGHNSISVLLQEVSGVPTFYFGPSIYQVCAAIRSGEVKGAKYDNESGHYFMLHLSENP